jgi:hypothetical protein
MKNAETITQNWIRANGMQVSTFNSTPIKLLQAQQQATNLLLNYTALLTKSQVQTLQNFQKRMSHKNTRTKLKPEHAYPVLNIATKIKRIEHKQQAN